jgi:hypothetical protein
VRKIKNGIAAAQNGALKEEILKEKLEFIYGI